MSRTVYTDLAFSARREVRAQRVLNIALAIIAVLSGCWAIGIALFVDGEQVWLAVAFNIVVATLSAALLLLHHRLAFRLQAHLVVAVSYLYICFLQLKVEGLSPVLPPSVHLWFLVLAVIATLVMFRERRAVLIAYMTVTLLTFNFFTFTTLESAPVIAFAHKERLLAQGLTFLSVFITMIVLMLAWDREVRNAEDNLLIANNLMEDLLVNMLPRRISERLRREGKTFADGVPDCSVMFVDIVGFTKLSSDMPPDQLVMYLDEIFSDFDELTSRAGLEKIKTMGDSYMVAAGIPDPRPDHAQALVRLAMEMQAVIRRHGLHVRCGINSGSVVAGVIGRKKFIYDLWGDTVNVASRMESQGVTDEIQVTETTARLIRDQFALTARADIDIKGKGKMPVFLVAGVRFRPNHA